MTRMNLGRYAIDYQEAVNVLLNDKTWKRDFTVYPIIFLYRHYMELKLKEIILHSWEFMKISRPFPEGHKVYELWNICRNCLIEIDKQVDPGFAQSREYVEQITGAYDALQADINRFAEIDPDSQHFRYPVDKHGNPITIDNKLLAKLQRELPELVKRISYNLDGISTGIYTILQDKYDGLSQS